MANSPVVFKITPMPVCVTADDIGCQLACDCADNQAAMLRAFTEYVEKYEAPLESWVTQCRAIAEKLTDKECRRLYAALYTLQEHLEAVPNERREAGIDA